MQNDDTHHLLTQLAAAVGAGQGGQAQRLSETAFNALLKSVYARVRGRVSAPIMRDLLALEIELGGESGDFTEFDNLQMVNLFVRGDVVGRLSMLIGSGTVLSAALDLEAAVGWLSAHGSSDPTRRAAGLQMLHAWMRLLAQEAGLVEPDHDRSPSRPLLSGAPAAVSVEARTAPRDYTDPITGMRLVWVPGGTFSMGDTFDQGVDDEKPVHEVRLSPFYMGIYPVTQQQWCRLMPQNPSAFTGDDHPVEQVSLADVMAFLEKRNAAAAGDQRFALPSEAQWEYAARSGGADELYAGGQDPESVAWFEDDQIGHSAAVGGKAPNGLGLFDMSGNVWEWCRDRYNADAYRRHAKIDPVCTRGESDYVIRGGSWHLDAWSARCARRFRFDPQLFGPALGFRVVMTMEVKG